MILSGSLGLDVVKTHVPHLRQVTGIIGFLFTNAYLAYRKFKPGQAQLKHGDFKIELAAKMLKYAEGCHDISLRSASACDISMLQEEHRIARFAHSKPCYMCRHANPQSSKRVNTTFCCEKCNVPLCKPSHPSGRLCWNMHLDGLPKARYFGKSKQ